MLGSPLPNCFSPINGDETDVDTASFLFAKSICALWLYSKSPKGAKTVKRRTGNCKIKFWQKHIFLPKLYFYLVKYPNPLLWVIVTNG